MPDESFGDRIKQLRGDVSQAAFAKRYGLSKNTLWSYENGESDPKASFVMKLASDFGVSADWLLFGVGEPPCPQLSSRESALLDDYRASDEEDKRILERTGASFAKSGVDGQDQDDLRSAAWPAGEKKKEDQKRE